MFRVPKLFCAESYLALNPDLPRDWTTAQAQYHYVTQGAKAKRPFTVDRANSILPFPIPYALPPEGRIHLIATQRAKGAALAQRETQNLWREIENRAPARESFDEVVVPRGSFPQRPSAVVFLHIGARKDLFPQFWERAISLAAYSSHVSLIVTLFGEEDETIHIPETSPKAPAHLQMRMVRVENRGLDILPFLSALLDSPELKTADAIFKWHAKTDDKIRSENLATIDYYTPDIFSTFQTSETTHLAARFIFEPARGTVNESWIRRILTECGFPPMPLRKEASITFPFCTFFVLRAEFVRRKRSVFESLRSICQQHGNTPQSIDWHWWCLMRHIPPSPDNAAVDLASVGGDPKRAFPFFGHAYWGGASQLHIPEILMRDGMFEHAMERIFGTLCAGKMVLGGNFVQV